MKTVIIVESPAKSKTIQHYLGSEYIVEASVGHIRELAKNGPGGLGVDVENKFKATYKVDKKHAQIVKDLIKVTKNNRVLLATDPDREGEAIAWHIADVLNLDLNEPNRITFNEVTKPAIIKAIEQPRKIDMNLVKSQETRRILDRIIGFKLSPLLQKKIKSESAGRVQSVALKLIVDLEKEIEAFVPQTYFTIKAKFSKFEADYTKNKDKTLGSVEELNAIIEKLNGPFNVTKVNLRKRSRQAQPPYTTSTFQQDAVSKLNYTPSKAMGIAQELYQGIKIGGSEIGLITYMRTDSVRLNDDFIKEAQSMIETVYGPNYVGKIKTKNTENIQDAHEAIRPSVLEMTPESLKGVLTDEQYKIYELIYRRAVMSLMADAQYEEQSVELENQGEVFEYGGSRLLFLGFHKGNPEYKEKSSTILDLEVGKRLEAKEIIHEENQTKPKSRYTEASLIKDMEEFGIGRPSTYAETTRTLLARKYIEKKQKALVPTEQGKLTILELDNYFSNIINTQYTKKMETVLDNISNGEHDSAEILDGFYHKFIALVKHADEHMEKRKPTEVGRDCPLCGAPLVIRKWRKGEFIGCSNFPRCKHTENLT
ncbi:type I DNA topoisomerase [Acholeplasma vituli]|uniref:DNA topoisomerase 1 n=1 Tax=Paracholeplasma vituli TaxID=69473 RepID=A0ABT2PUZ8_9MOLU|nr:type I DNA topoisomerase [Paracholeplasma vituli]MCU0104773.1 type I DNA topoisomerase [Paracholeplasma vituli]